MKKYMTYSEMIEFVRCHPFVAVSHFLFDDVEYLFLNDDGNVYDEEGCLFESWSWSPDIWCGKNIKDVSIWASGWFVKSGVNPGLPE